MRLSVSVCFWKALILLCIAYAADGRGRNRGRGGGRRRARRGSGGKNRGWSWNNEDTDPVKPEDAIQKCTARLPLPPTRIGGIVSEWHPQSPESWMYFRLLPPGLDGAKLEPVPWTTERQNLCQNLLVGKQLPTRPEHAESVVTCVIAFTDATEEALFISDYNKERGLPNYVAFVAPSVPNISAILNEDGRQGTEIGMPSLDAAYDAGAPELCCWCSDVDQSSQQQDDVCSEAVGVVGHLAPLSAFKSGHMSAGNVFFNTVPMRVPFAGQQWLQRLQDLFEQAQTLLIRTPERKMHVVIGPSLQTDGRLPSSVSSAGRFIEVPAYLWTAYSDPYAQAAGAYFCRNGGIDDECACVDRLKIGDVEERLGFKVFPGLHAGPKYLHLQSTYASKRYGFSYVFYGFLIVAVLISVACAIMCCMEEESKSDGHTEGTPGRSIRDKFEDAARERKRRNSLERAVGGKDALRARFNKV